MSKLNEEELLAWFNLIAEKAKEGFTVYDEKHFEKCHQQIKEVIKKPEVTEEWIWKAIDYIKEYPTYHRLEEKLKEIGVKIIKNGRKQDKL